MTITDEKDPAAPRDGEETGMPAGHCEPATAAPRDGEEAGQDAGRPAKQEIASRDTEHVFEDREGHGSAGTSSRSEEGTPREYRPRSGRGRDFSSPDGGPSFRSGRPHDGDRDRDSRPVRDHDGERGRDRDFRSTDGGSSFRSDRPRDRDYSRPRDRDRDRDRDSRPDRRPPLRETVADIDKSILKMLVKRYNCLQRMSATKGHLDPREEKFLRENWETAASKMSRDARLIRQMFSLIQEVEFLPRREPGEEVRQGFNLAPVRKPVKLAMKAPVSSRKSRAWIALGALSNTPVTLQGTLLNDDVVDCCKMFNQLGASVSWQENGTVLVREGGAFAPEDKVVFAGDSLFNFALLLGAFLKQHSRAKFTGGSTLKSADFSTLRRFLPLLGSRLVNAMPKSDGFPVRLECSGILPASVVIPEDMQPELVEGLLLSAMLWERPVAFDLRNHPRREAILGFVLPFLKITGGGGLEQETLVRAGGQEIRIPGEPVVPVDLSLTATLLALSAVTGGKVELDGVFPHCPIAEQIQQLLSWAGADVLVKEPALRAVAGDRAIGRPLDASHFAPKIVPLVVGCAAFHALRGASPVKMPLLPEDADITVITSFLEYAGLAVNGEGFLESRAPGEGHPEIWTAPTAQWALALALASFAHGGFKLSNAGIMTTLYPSFWALFNSLPDPELKHARQQELIHEPVVRRRIITGQPAVLRERDNDD